MLDPSRYGSKHYFMYENTILNNNVIMTHVSHVYCTHVLKLVICKQIFLLHLLIAAKRVQTHLSSDPAGRHAAHTPPANSLTDWGKFKGSNNRVNPKTLKHICRCLYRVAYPCFVHDFCACKHKITLTDSNCLCSTSSSLSLWIKARKHKKHKQSRLV